MRCVLCATRVIHMNINRIRDNHNPPSSLIHNNNQLKEEMTKLLKNLHADGYTYYVTFRSRPVVNRKHLEGMIKEWSKRLNRKLLGRHWWKNSHRSLRMGGIVFFETAPDVHAHATIKPPVTKNFQLTEYQIINLFEDQWSTRLRPGMYGFKKTSKDQVEQHKRAIKNSVNLLGDCLVQRLNTGEDARRAGWYSLKQSRFQSMSESDDFKFIEDLESYRSNYQTNKRTH